MAKPFKDVMLALGLENMGLGPEARRSTKLDFKLDSAKPIGERSLVGLRHGPAHQNFEKTAGICAIGSIAVQGKCAIELFEQEPQGKHGRAYISPLASWLTFDPLGHSWISKADQSELEREAFTPDWRPLHPHSRSLGESIRHGEKVHWSSGRLERLLKHPNALQNEAIKNRTR